MYHCQKRITRYFLFCLFTIISGCEDSEVETRSYPVIDTKTVTDINSDGATFNGDVLNAGESGISDHGFVFNSSPNPLLESSNVISLGPKTGKGSFSIVANRNMANGETYHVRAYAVSGGNQTIVYGQDISFVSLGGSPPEIADFSPTLGSIGDTVTIRGSGFSNVFNNNIVNIGTTRVQVFQATAELLKVTIPDHLPLGAQEVKVRVGQYEVVAEKKFALIPITITTFSPFTISFRDTITINGANFPTSVKSKVQVTVIDEPATIVEFTSSRIKVIPSDYIKKPQGSVKVTVGTQNLSYTDVIKLNKPLISSIDPAKGSGQSQVKITGNHFTPAPASIDVKLNGTKADVISSDLKSITVKVPSGIPAGTYPFSVTIAEQNVLSPGFEIIKPSINNISPLVGTWGSTLTITGENFSNSITGNVVLFNTISATVISASPTEIKVTVPEGLLQKSSTISVRVFIADDQTVVFPTPFMLTAPVITDMNPKDGKSNTLVTITGQNLNSNVNNHAVTFGTYTAEVISATPTSLVVKVPKGIDDSSVPVTVTLAEQSNTFSQNFHLISPWRRIADFPSNAREACTAFTIGSYGYVGLGTKFHFSSPPDFFKYDAATDTWSTIPDFSYFSSGGSGSYTGQAAFVIGNEAYVGLGAIGETWLLNEFSKYDAVSNTWLDATNCQPADAIDGAVCYSINNKGYVTSGRNYLNQPEFKLLEYDPVADQLTRKADFQGPARMEATGFALSGKAYLTTGFGYVNDIMYNDMWVYDPATNQWAQRNGIPGSARWKATAFTLNGKGYVIGGASSYDAYYNRLKDMWQYDPVTNQWTRLEDFPGTARYSAVAFVVGNKAYFGTGLGASTPDGLLKDFWEYDPSKL